MVSHRARLELLTHHFKKELVWVTWPISYLIVNPMTRILKIANLFLESYVNIVTKDIFNGEKKVTGSGDCIITMNLMYAVCMKGKAHDFSGVQRFANRDNGKFY
jgi:hypothetical protein